MGTRDQSVAILSALFVNVPLITLFVLLARRIMLRTAAVLAAALSADSVPHRAHDVAIPFATTWREQEIDNRSPRNLQEPTRDPLDSSD
jgi:hypothetical protein